MICLIFHFRVFTTRTTSRTKTDFKQCFWSSLAYHSTADSCHDVKTARALDTAEKQGGTRASEPDPLCKQSSRVASPTIGLVWLLSSRSRSRGAFRTAPLTSER